jgi:hypothetical protein
MSYKQLRAADTPQPVAPGHSFLLGHLWYLKTMFKKLPKDCHYTYVFCDIHKEHFHKEGAYYLDLLPLRGVILAVFSPGMAMAITQTNYDIATS